MLFIARVWRSTTVPIPSSASLTDLLSPRLAGVDVCDVLALLITDDTSSVLVESIAPHICFLVLAEFLLNLVLQASLVESVVVIVFLGAIKHDQTVVVSVLP